MCLPSTVPQRPTGTTLWLSSETTRAPTLCDVGVVPEVTQMCTRRGSWKEPIWSCPRPPPSTNSVSGCKPIHPAQVGWVGALSRPWAAAGATAAETVTKPPSARATMRWQRMLIGTPCWLLAMPEWTVRRVGAWLVSSGLELGATALRSRCSHSYHSKLIVSRSESQGESPMDCSSVRITFEFYMHLG